MRTRRFTARCVRSGDWWAVTVPEARGVYTQARRLSEVEAMARDAIALAKGLSADSFEVVVAPDLPSDLAAEVEAVRELRDTADRSQREATAASRAVAAKLVDRYKLPFRDVGRILGVSHQRVGQLLAPPRERG